MNKLICVMLFLSSLAFGEKLKSAPRIVSCDDSKSQIIRIPYSRVTTLNFPTTPKEAIPGEGGFDIKRIQQDLVIKAMRMGSSTNLVVYLESRRCFFHLVSSTKGDESVFVRDPKEMTIEVKFADK